MLYILHVHKPSESTLSHLIAWYSEGEMFPLNGSPPCVSHSHYYLMILSEGKGLTTALLLDFQVTLIIIVF